jgi:hypothetical protein
MSEQFIVNPNDVESLVTAFKKLREKDPVFAVAAISTMNVFRNNPAIQNVLENADQRISNPLGSIAVRALKQTNKLYPIIGENEADTKIIRSLRKAVSDELINLFRLTTYDPETISYYLRIALGIKVASLNQNQKDSRLPNQGT